MRPRKVYRWPGRVVLVLAILLGYWLGHRDNMAQLRGIAQMLVIGQQEHQRLGRKEDAALKVVNEINEARQPRKGALPAISREE